MGLQLFWFPATVTNLHMNVCEHGHMGVCVLMCIHTHVHTYAGTFVELEHANMLTQSVGLFWQGSVEKSITFKTNSKEVNNRFLLDSNEFCIADDSSAGLQEKNLNLLLKLPAQVWSRWKRVQWRGLFIIVVIHQVLTLQKFSSLIVSFFLFFSVAKSQDTLQRKSLNKANWWIKWARWEELTAVRCHNCCTHAQTALFLVNQTHWSTARINKTKAKMYWLNTHVFFFSSLYVSTTGFAIICSSGGQGVRG